MFFIQNLVNNNLFKNNHIVILWNVLQFIGLQNSSGFLLNSISRRIFASQLGLVLRVGLILKSSLLWLTLTPTCSIMIYDEK